MAILALLQALFWIICANYLQEHGFRDGAQEACLLSAIFLAIGIFLHVVGQEPKDPKKRV